MINKNVSILLFHDVEVMDFAGPFEIFSVTNELNCYKLFNIFTVAPLKGNIIAKNGLSINPSHYFANAPNPDILILPGGYGVRKLLTQPEIVQWVIANSNMAEIVLSVCTGAFLLAKAGLLEGLRATTHYSVIEELSKIAPKTEIIRNTRFVDNGKILTSAGVSAGIDLSLYVVGLICGEKEAKRTAQYLEFDNYRPCK